MDSHAFDQAPGPEAQPDIDQLRKLLYTDDLTGLYNRRFFRHSIAELKNQSDASKSTFSLLIMDVDHFKQINDSYGHAVGDAALIAVSRALQELMGDAGAVFRYAGDEFVALLKNCDEAAARACAGRLLPRAATSLEREAPDFPLRTISLSIGIAVYPDDGDSISSLFQAADQALYASKQGGRNCFHSAQELSRRPAAERSWPIRVHCESLIGRQQQWAQLQHHFAECKNGHGRLVLVTGEAGIGKSRLLRQFVRRQRAGDYHVLYGECTEGTTVHSYAPVRDALKKGFEAQDPATINVFRQLEPHCRRELIDLVPQFDRYEKEPHAAAPAADRYLLLESILALLQGLAKQLPTVMVLEDLHWSDDATLNLIQYLARNIRNEKLLLLATFRDEEALLSKLPSIIQNMSRESLFEKIGLNPLTADETAQMLEELFQGYTTYLSFKEWVHEETEGIPFYIEEFLKLLLDEGYIQRVGNEIEARKPDKFLLPYSIRALIQRRISRLGEAQQRILGFASIIGNEFELNILLQLIEENEGYVLDLLDELMRLQLIREVVAPGAERYRFKHNKIRDVIYEEMGLIKRKKVHRRVGEILESLHADELTLYAEDLAHHFEQAGVMKKAFQYSLEAGKKALQIHAYLDAQVHLDHCFQYGDLMENSGVELLAELHACKAATMEALEAWDEAIRSYRQLLAIRKVAGSRSQQASVLNHLSRIHYRKEDFDGAAEAAREALGLAEAAADAAEICRSSFNLGKYYWRIGNPQQALQHMQKASSLPDTAELELEKANYLNTTGTLMLEACDYSGARAGFARALAIYRKNSSKLGILECQVNFGILERIEGSLSRARRQIAEASAMSQEIGDPYRMAACAVNAAEVELELSEYEQANRLNERAGRIYNEIGHSLGQTHFLQNEAGLHRIQGNLDAALETVAKALTIAEDHSLKHRYAELLLEEARALYYQGAWTDCRQRLEAAQQHFLALKNAAGFAIARLKLGFLHMITGDAAQARALWKETLDANVPQASVEHRFWRLAASGFCRAFNGESDTLLVEQVKMKEIAAAHESAELKTVASILSCYQLHIAGKIPEALAAGREAEALAVRCRQALHLARIRMKILELRDSKDSAGSAAEARILLEAARTHPQHDIVHRALKLLCALEPDQPALSQERQAHWESWKAMIPASCHLLLQPS